MTDATAAEELHEVLLLAAAVVCEDPPPPLVYGNEELWELVKVLRAKGYITHSDPPKQTK